ncbi:MAG: hypothetical protein JXR22_07925 [Prolixibacteraceae bacterium]|nr:hypothetical protein [Prolixibacteraceae bacterium]
MLILFLQSPGLLAAVSADLTNLKFAVINQKNGLASNNVECILKDADGFMWFGTRNGLCRFDGYDIKTYTATDHVNSLSGNRILCMAEDTQGYLWIGTYNNGLNRYNKLTESFQRFGIEKGIGDRINNIKVLRDGSVWICSNQGLALYRAESNDFKIFNDLPDAENALPSHDIYDLFETRSGNLYLTCERQEIFLFDPNNKTFTPIAYQRSEELKSNFNKQIAEDQNGNLWIAADTHGLSFYDPKSGRSELLTKENGGLSTNLLTGDLVTGPDGNIWLCTDGGGINILDPLTRKLTELKQNGFHNNLLSNTFYTIYFDDNQRLWTGTFDEGVLYADPEVHKFSPSLYIPNDLYPFRNKSIISLFRDSKQNIWIGTDGDGLYRVDPSGAIKVFRVEPGNIHALSSNVITAINEDRYGNLIVGTYAGGLNVLNPRTGQFVHYLQAAEGSEQINSSSIWNILADSRGRIWLGLLADGLALYNPTDHSFSNLGPSSNSPLKIDFPNVMAIMEDADGDIWFGTEGKGLFVLDHQSGRMIKPADDSLRHLSSQGIIKCIYQDKWENIWIGTEGSGLFKYHKTSRDYTVYTSNEGLPSNIIQSIIDDQHGNLWLGTSRGLSRMDVLSGEIHTFIEPDGLSGDEFNQNAVVKLNDSRMMMGNTRGLDVFNPSAIRLNQNLPRMVFTSLTVMNQEISAGTSWNNNIIIAQNINKTEHISLTYREKTFTLGFAAINYTLPQKCQYAYQLEGYDEDWTYTDSDKRTASYSNLPPGTYHFRVKASNNDGLWGNNERKLEIIILPPFYKTIWFQTLMALLGMTIIFFIYQYRLNLLKNRFMKKQLEQERKILNLENEKLEAELQKLTFHILNRNRALIDQKNRLLGLSSKARESVRLGLQEIIQQFDEELSDDKDWKHIEPQLDKVYNNFVSNLKSKHPDLTLTEIKIAAYVRMNLTTKEITEFMHKTPRAVENDRYRLRKKMGLSNNDSLQQYLMDI